MAASDISVNDNRDGKVSVERSIPNGSGDSDPNRDKVLMAARCPQHRPGTILNPVAFNSLAEASDELWIELEGQLYRLRKTKQGKLILTK